MRERKSPRDIYQEITDSIVAAIENCDGQVRLPWQRSGLAAALPTNPQTGNAYQGVNVLGFLAVAHNRNYSTNLWASYAQWQTLGAQVRGGAKAAMVVFYKSYTAEPDPQNADDDGNRRVANASFVFNVQDVDGFELPNLPQRPLIQRIAAADDFFDATGITIRTGGEQAFYRVSDDVVQMPDERLFDGPTEEERTGAYYSTLGHEVCHAVGHPKRLNRQFGKRFADDAYCAEEICVELGASFLMAHLGLSAVPRAEHAQYLQHWLHVMRADKKAIFAAAARAQEAVNYLISLQPKQVADAE